MSTIHGGAIGHGLNCPFLMYTSSYLIELMVSLKSTGGESWNVGCLSIKFIFIFLSDGLLAAGMSIRSYGYILPLADPIPWQWTDIRHPD